MIRLPCIIAFKNIRHAQSAVLCCKTGYHICSIFIQELHLHNLQAVLIVSCSCRTCLIDGQPDISGGLLIKCILNHRDLNLFCVFSAAPAAVVITDLGEITQLLCQSGVIIFPVVNSVPDDSAVQCSFPVGSIGDDILPASIRICNFQPCFHCRLRRCCGKPELPPVPRKNRNGGGILSFQKRSHIIGLISQTYISVSVSRIHMMVFCISFRIHSSCPFTVNISLVSPESRNIKSGRSHLALKLLLRTEYGRRTALVQTDKFCVLPCILI